MLADPVLINDWHPVIRSDELTEGKIVGTRLLGEDLVLWRVDGSVQAWQDLCVHRGTRLSLGKIENGTLVCPYHGWTYNQEGRCVRMPAHPDQTPPLKARVKTFHVKERYGLVWVTLGEPKHNIPPFPEDDDPSYRKVLCGPFGPVRASAPRAIENFLDVAHFPFVHGGTLGDEKHPEIQDYKVETGPEGVSANDVRVYQPDPYGTGEGDIVYYTYRVFRPLTAYLAKEIKNGIRFSILFPITPHEEIKSTVWFYMAMNPKYDLPDEEVKQFHSSILAQDIPIIESQRPELLPLDLQAEMHLRSDRTAVAYRKWLRDLGVSFGTA